MIFGILYLASILLANVLVYYFGILEFGPLMFPAGAVVIGMTFSLRDLVQKEYGKWKCWYWTFAACAVSVIFSWELALASSLAFMVSEAVDWTVFTYSKGNLKTRMLLSNLFGTPLDSLVFVPLVFGWAWPAILGQALVKFVSSLVILFFVKK